MALNICSILQLFCCAKANSGHHHVSWEMSFRCIRLCLFQRLEKNNTICLMHLIFNLIKILFLPLRSSKRFENIVLIRNCKFFVAKTWNSSPASDYDHNGAVCDATRKSRSTINKLKEHKMLFLLIQVHCCDIVIRLQSNRSVTTAVATPLSVLPSLAKWFCKKR